MAYSIVCFPGRIPYSRVKLIVQGITYSGVKCLGTSYSEVKCPGHNRSVVHFTP